jgi:hypothetical protein
MLYQHLWTSWRRRKRISFVKRGQSPSYAELGWIGSSFYFIDMEYCPNTLEEYLCDSSTRPILYSAQKSEGGQNILGLLSDPLSFAFAVDNTCIKLGLHSYSVAMYSHSVSNRKLRIMIWLVNASRKSDHEL